MKQETSKIEDLKATIRESWVSIKTSALQQTDDIYQHCHVGAVIQAKPNQTGIKFLRMNIFSSFPSKVHYC